MRKLLLLITLLASGVATLRAQQVAPNLVLHGEVTGVQNKTYFEIPFDVPVAVHRISVDFSYTGKDQKTTLDLGIADPERFRGNSGGNKSHFTLSESDATPSYLPGAIPAGKWRLLISVPNIRPNEGATYRAEIRFNDRSEDRGFVSGPLEMGTRWYRGDLHMHTANSDGSCPSQSGKRVPCPVFFTAQAATQRGLDFIAITDHNATSQYNDMRELQPYFDKLLLIPGREITTFWGHFNIFGITEYINYRVQPSGRDVNAVLRDVRAKGGIASINHAESPDGEICMGCGWKPRTDVDMKSFTGVEVNNGGRLSSADFWDSALAKGVRLTAVGGSDNHNASLPAGTSSAIGVPTTVVEAAELSVPAILEGIRDGRVFIDVTGSRDKIIDLEAHKVTAGAIASEKPVRMGGTLHVRAGDHVDFQIRVSSCAGATAHVLIDGHETPAVRPFKIDARDATPSFSLNSDGGYHWVRIEVRDDNGNLMLISNPIYINPPTT